MLQHMQKITNNRQVYQFCNQCRIFISYTLHIMYPVNIGHIKHKYSRWMFSRIHPRRSNENITSLRVYILIDNRRLKSFAHFFFPFQFRLLLHAFSSWQLLFISKLPDLDSNKFYHDMEVLDTENILNCHLYSKKRVHQITLRLPRVTLFCHPPSISDVLQ